MRQAFPVKILEMIENNPKSGESEKEFFFFCRQTEEMTYNSCLLQVRDISYLQAIAIKSISANRKLAINHSKGQSKSFGLVVG